MRSADLANALFSAALLSAAAISASHCAALNIDTVWVDNRGNADAVAPNPELTVNLGGVSYPFRMGKYEVTNAQYAEFLNAVAHTDAVNLYAISLDDQPWGGILRSGIAGSYSYVAKLEYEDKPVNYISFWDAVRFANWMHNGQPIGAVGPSTTEDGAYTLLGSTPVPTNRDTVARNPNARWFVPSPDEWYKAAYYDPRSQAQGGPPGNDHYWRFATQSDSTPIEALANAVGDVSNPGSNVANFDHGASWIPPGERFLLPNLTTVGTSGSFSYYGTADQTGNLNEWTDTDANGVTNSEYRGMFGGGWQDDATRITSAYFNFYGTPYNDGGGAPNDNGFRLATLATNPLPGDFTLNGNVDAADYIIWRNTSGLTGAGLTADANSDGKVNPLATTSGDRILVSVMRTGPQARRSQYRSQRAF